MKMILSIAVFVVCTAFGQEAADLQASCTHEIYLKGMEKGWYRLSPGEIPTYVKLRIACWRSGKRKVLPLRDQISRGGEDLRSQRPMHGWTSTHAAIVTMTVSYYFLHRSLK